MSGKVENLKLEEFSISDLDEIIEIEKNSFPNRVAFSREYLQKLYQNYPEGFVVAKIEKEIVGYGIGQIKGDWGEIISLAVKSNWREKGIGTFLAKFLINNFQKKGVNSVLLHVRKKNETAISFYQKLGFKILKKIKNYYLYGDVAFLMEKELGG